MNKAADTRLALVFGAAADARPGDALLMEGRGADGPGRAWFSVTALHAAGCPCCAPRNAAGQALSRLLLARARGDGIFFSRVVAVVVTPEGRAAVLAALETDPIVSAWLRPL